MRAAIFLLILMLPLVSAECIDINELLSERYPYEGGGGYYKIYQYRLSTELIHDYDGNSELLDYSATPFGVSDQYPNGVHLSVVEGRWKSGARVWLPEPGMGEFLYKYDGSQDTGSVAWESVPVECTEEAEPVPDGEYECEGINDVLKGRYPYESGTGSYKVYQYGQSTRLIYDYEDNSEVLSYTGSRSDPTKEFPRGVHLDEKDDAWKPGVTVWLPAATHEIGSFLYHYDGTQDTSELEWEKVEIRCTMVDTPPEPEGDPGEPADPVPEQMNKYELKDGYYHYTVVPGDSFLRIYYHSKDDTKLSLVEFLELNTGRFEGVDEYLDRIRNKEDISGYNIVIHPGDEVIVAEQSSAGEEELDEHDKAAIQSAGIRAVEADPVGRKKLSFDSRGAQVDLEKLAQETYEETGVQNIFLRVYPDELGSMGLPEYTDLFVENIEDSWMEDYPLEVNVFTFMELEEDDWLFSLGSLNQEFSYEDVRSAVKETAGTDDLKAGFIEILIDKPRKNLRDFLNKLGIAKKKIIIDPGHGRVCWNGDVTTYGKQDIETQLNTRFSSELKSVFQEEFGLNADLVMTRETDNFNPGSLYGIDNSPASCSKEYCYCKGGETECVEEDRELQPYIRNRVHAGCVECMNEECGGMFRSCMGDQDLDFEECFEESCRKECISYKDYINGLKLDMITLFDMKKFDPHKADMFLSIHHNACGNLECYGPRVFFYDDSDEPLVRDLCKNMVAAYNEHRGDMPELSELYCIQKNDFAVLDEAKESMIPGVLIEVGFMDSKLEREAELIGITSAEGEAELEDSQVSQEFRKDMENAIAKSVSDYFDFS